MYTYKQIKKELNKIGIALLDMIDADTVDLYVYGIVPLYVNEPVVISPIELLQQSLDEELFIRVRDSILVGHNIFTYQQLCEGVKSVDTSNGENVTISIKRNGKKISVFYSCDTIAKGN
jgi:hypothetical protein